MEKFYTPKEVAQILGVSVNYLAKNRNPKYNKNKDGSIKNSVLPFVLIGRCVRYPQSELERFIEQNKIKQN